MVQHDKITIGRRELADLPDFGLQQVQVKVDTGAYTSSIHVSSAEEIDGLLHVVFLDDQHPSFTGTLLCFDLFRKKKVKSSTGQVQERYFVYGQICLADLCFSTEFSLTIRKGMRFPILLGRKVLNHRFIVDTSRKYIHAPTASSL